MNSASITRIHGHRRRLPDRRITRTIEINWPVGSDRYYTISVGFDEHGAVRELFADWQKAGSELESIIDDACVGYSLALQFGADIADLARTLGREGTYTIATMLTGEDIETPAASILGQICQIAAHIEAAEGAEIQRAYAGENGSSPGPTSPADPPEPSGPDHV
jgi:hypothetical protein